MSLLAMIPARRGSKRLPNKNFLLCNGKSLVKRAQETAIQAGIFDEIVTTTDEDRHPYLCDDHVQTAAVVFDVLCKLNYRHDEFCVLNPTSPLRTPIQIQDGYRYFKEWSGWALASGIGLHDGNFLFANTLEFLRRMVIIDKDTRFIKLAGASVDINTIDNFREAEKILIEREGYKGFFTAQSDGTFKRWKSL